jgi:hypothetical protein
MDTGSGAGSRVAALEERSQTFDHHFDTTPPLIKRDYVQPI